MVYATKPTTTIKQIEENTIRTQGYDTSPVVIGSDVWIGVGAALLKGAMIGNRAVVAAHAVVTVTIPDYEVWGGVPARELGERR